MWYGVKTSSKPSYGRNSKNTPLTPVVLTLISRDDLELRKAGYSEREIREKKIVRLFMEAYEQGALLTHSDVAFLLHVSTGTVSRQVNEYMKKTGVIVPTRGVIHDIDRAMSHKSMVEVNFGDEEYLSVKWEFRRYKRICLYTYISY